MSLKRMINGQVVNIAGSGGSSGPSITQAAYEDLVEHDLDDPNIPYFIYDAEMTGAPIDDTTTALDKVWSSSKTASEIAQGGGSNITLTQAQYDQLSQAQKEDLTKVYYITDGSSTGNLSDMGDVSITTPSNGQFLRYNNTSGKWENSTYTVNLPVWTTSVTGQIGDTSVTIQNSAIHTTSIIEPFADNGTNTPMAPPTQTVTEGQCVLGFDALEAATSFVLRVTNL